MKQCENLLINNKLNQENSLNVRLYIFAISNPQYTWEDIHRIFFNERLAGEKANTSYISRKLEKFKNIAAEYDIPFIPALDFKNNPESTIIENMLKQIDEIMQKYINEKRQIK